MKYVFLCVLVIAWCVLHSALISVSVTEYLHRRMGPAFRFYRLFYNLVSALTLMPVLFYAASERTEPMFRWDGYLRIIQVVLLGTAAVLFLLGARRYDAGQLLGVRQIRAGISKSGIAHAGELDTSGILGMMRHPWYLAVMLLIWARQLDISAILVNVILTFYLIVGACLEERKLVREFGEKYRAYQERVPMLVPYGWLKNKMHGREDRRNRGGSR
jgi:protein-S-isoprenylcysteine O-methyltransferase Ste14